MSEKEITPPLVYRHNRVTRATHWINALALIVLFMSGLQIFNAFPRLHWGNKAEPGDAFLAIFAAETNGEARGYTRILDHRFDTTGVLGVQFTDNGPLPRAFPSWSTIPGYFWLAGGRRWHFFFGWLFVINGLFYVIYNTLTGHARKFLLTFRDAVKIPAMVLYYLHLRRESPQDTEYNPLQKLAYTSVFLILTPLALLTGMAMSPQLNIAFNSLPAMFGGRQSARAIHFILAFGFLFFTLSHVFMVLTTGMINNMRSMVTGWYKEKVSTSGSSILLPEPLDVNEEEMALPDTPSSTEPEPAPPEKTDHEKADS